MRRHANRSICLFVAFVNTFGEHFRFTSWGESHGGEIGVVVDGCPPGLALCEADIQPDLQRRRPGKNRYTTQRREPDEVRIASGLYQGKTTGAPIAMRVANTDQRSRDYKNISRQLRPAHADYTWQAKYGVRDPRGGGRSSARETVARCCAGAIARKYLQQELGTVCRGRVVQVGGAHEGAWSAKALAKSEIFCGDAGFEQEVVALIEQARRDGDSLGAVVEVQAAPVPVGLGEPLYSKLDAALAGAMMSIPAVRGVEFGAGFAIAAMPGTQARDALDKNGPVSNHAGGIVGGVSNGAPIVLRMVFKPTSSLTTPVETLDLQGEMSQVVTTGRHDPCVGIRGVPVAEAMTLVCLMDALLAQRRIEPDAARQSPLRLRSQKLPD